MEFYQNEYIADINKIRSRKNTTTVLCIVFSVLTVILASPSEIILMGKPLFIKEGLNQPLWIIPTLILIWVLTFFSWSLTFLPISNSLIAECDPKKYIALSSVFLKNFQRTSAYSTAYLFLGDFNNSVKYSNIIISLQKKQFITNALYNKALSEYFLGNYAEMKNTVNQYYAIGNTIKNKNSKKGKRYIKIQNVLTMLCALADDDTEKITELTKVMTPYGNSYASDCILNFIKGVADFKTGDKKDCFYRMMFVKDAGCKTVFATLADDYLKQL